MEPEPEEEEVEPVEDDLGPQGVLSRNLRAQDALVSLLLRLREMEREHLLPDVPARRVLPQAIRSLLRALADDTVAQLKASADDSR